MNHLKTTENLKNLLREGFLKQTETDVDEAMSDFDDYIDIVAEHN